MVVPTEFRKLLALNLQQNCIKKTETSHAENINDSFLLCPSLKWYLPAALYFSSNLNHRYNL